MTNKGLETITQPVPQFSENEARTLARDLFGVTATARPLPSERDQNFLLETGSGPEFVLKIANSAEARGVLEAQNAVLEHLARQAPSLQCPRVRATTTGETIGMVRRPDVSVHFVRLLTYVPGHLLVEVSPHPPDLLHSLGAFFGRLDQALASFGHPALKRKLHWDLKHASDVVARHLEHLATPHQRALVQRFAERFRERVEPALPRLGASVIHNDGNDYNVLVTGIRSRGGEVTGVVDFGDLIETHTVFELAVCTAYAILGKNDPVAAAAQVVGGYHRVNPLTEQELELLYDLVAMRLCTSVAMSALQKKRHPDNAYLTVSEGPAWAALERLAQVSPRLFSYAFRNACGLPACPRTTVVQWLEANSAAFGPVVAPDVRTGQYFAFDLSAGSAELAEVGDPADTPRFTEALFDRMRAAGVRVGVGRYDEARRSYTTERYRPVGSDVEDWRTVHLGIDLFMEPSSPVFAPLDGTVHSFANNAQAQDYGPTIILRHDIGGAGEFFTLYGHLSKESLEGLSEGIPVAKGARIGAIGDSSVNGDWPPHLHFQIITDLLDQSGNFPGVCAAQDRALWLSLCPDPNLILQIPHLFKPTRGRSPEGILEARKHHLGRNLTVSYESPLKIVQGWMQYLYDHLGHEFLDAVNNVAHVGHCHPAVVRAAQQQMAVLNTNTRYLHDNLVAYAERLCATLPAPLRVCYFVCSGSEANELALRMARTHTKATDIIVVDGAYHGNTTSLIDISPYKFDGPGGAGAPPQVHKVVMPDRFRGPYKDRPEAGRRYAQHIQEALERAKRNGRRVAAFICESMLSCGGQIVLPPGYLAEAYRYVRETGGVCIADEIQVGFGRVGSHFWGFQTQGIMPDIVTMGKPMGNGHPLAAVVTTPEIAASFANGMEYFNTFGGNPVSCAVGLAVLEVIGKEGLQRNALTVGAYLKDGLSRLKAKHLLIGDVRGEGLFLGVELVRDPETLEPAAAEVSYVAERMKQLGVLTGIDGPFDNVLKIKPPMTFSKVDADRLTNTLDRILSEPRLKALRIAL
ncbi:MAG: aminotransferase class III-fold pyridoxal phosphate-dependent enzyme [Nitrospirae bacterium]|nr:aminotransferase class III-fold pyridoxal phosphate-dependent enzyme [Nitrospirota bacterium]